MPPTVSTIICVCWWVVLGVITAPSFVQVTVVAGPPVEVQVRVLDSMSNVSSVTLGAPACQRIQEQLWVVMSILSENLNGIIYTREITMSCNIILLGEYRTLWEKMQAYSALQHSTIDIQLILLRVKYQIIANRPCIYMAKQGLICHSTVQEYL